MPFEFSFGPKLDTNSNSNCNESENKNFKWFSFDDLQSKTETIAIKPFSAVVCEPSNITHAQTICATNASQLTQPPISDYSTISVSDATTSQLRSRVSKELEKIEIWKANTEMEIKRKDEEIDELNRRCDELRNKVIAFDNERQSFIAVRNQHKEEAHDLMVKVNNTREMLFRTKDMVNSLEKRVADFEEIEQVLTQLNNYRVEQIADLGKLFDDLSDGYRNKFSKMEHNMKTAEDYMSNLIHELREQCILKDSEITEMKEQLEQTRQESDNFKSDANKSINDLEINLSAVSEQKSVMESELKKEINDLLAEKNEIVGQLNQLNEQLSNLNIKLESSDNAAKEAEQQFVSEKSKFENELKQLSECCETLKSTNTELENRLFEYQNMFKENEITFNEMNIKIDSLVANNDSIEMSKLSIIKDYETRITELNRNIDQNVLMIEGLNKTKEKMETEIELFKNVINENEKLEKDLIKEMENLKLSHQTEVEEHKTAAQKLSESFEDIIKDLNTKIDSLLAEIVALKEEKQSLEKQLEHSKCQLDNEILNFTKILDSCKDDYSKRIDDKDERINEYKRENVKLNTNVNHLMSRIEKIETEKSEISRKLQEITFSTLRPITNSPIKVMSQRNVSPIEKPRVSAARASFGNASTSQMFDTSSYKSISNSGSLLEQSKQSKQKLPKEFENSAKPSNSSNSRATKVDVNENIYEYLAEKADKIGSNSKRPKITTKQQQQRRQQQQQPQKIMSKRTKSIAKPMRGKSGGKARSRVNMHSLLIESDDDDTEIEFNDAFATNAKSGLKTYSKTGANQALRPELNIRSDNIMKGRPTPTKTNDLSWLNF